MAIFVLRAVLDKFWARRMGDDCRARHVISAIKIDRIGIEQVSKPGSPAPPPGINEPTWYNCVLGSASDEVLNSAVPLAECMVWLMKPHRAIS